VLQPGQLLKDGSYRVVRPLSKGGMGALHLVEDLGAFGRLRVIKEMIDYVDPSDYKSQADYHQAVLRAHVRFEEEARTLAALNHPGIPDIIAYFSDHGRNYIVMEYVEGTDLRVGLTHEDEHDTMVAGGPYPVDDVVRWGGQLCKVLEYLAGIKPSPVIHHDIKPANLVLDEKYGEVRLVDFGTAKARLAAQAGPGGLQKPSVFGTQGYAPPEQYQGQSTTQSDVYALAATMYHLLTDDDPGDHPFSFPMAGQLDPSLAQVLEKALEMDPAKRSNAAQFRQDLAGWLESAHKAGDRPRDGALSKASTTSTSTGRRLAVVLLPIPDEAVKPTAQALMTTFRVTDQQAIAWCYAAPQVVLRTQSQAEATQLVSQLKAAQVAAHLVAVDDSLSAGLSAQQLQTLTAKGEAPGPPMSNLGADTKCHCYVCGHDWVSNRAAGSPPPTAIACPKCKASNWSLHRVFKCAMCGHEFAHGDQRRPARQLFPTCPACGTADWLPGQAPVLRLTEQRLKLGTFLPGQRRSAALQVTNTGGGTLRGVVRCREPWLSFEQPFTGAGRISLPIDSQQLVGERDYRGEIEVISNGGVATVPIELHAQTAERTTVSPVELDFGLVGAQPPQPLVLRVTNGGGGTLRGTVTATAPWIDVRNRAISGNGATVRVAIKPEALPMGGQALAGTIKLATNGGDVSVPVRVMVLPAALVVDTLVLDFGTVAPRETARRTLRVTNSGAGCLEGMVASAPDWVRIKQTRWSGNQADLLVEVDGRSLVTPAGPPTAGGTPSGRGTSGGIRTGAIHLTSNGGDATVTVRAVALSPTLMVEPSSINLGMLRSGQSAGCRVQVSNRGIGAVSGSVRTSGPWLRPKQDQFSGESADLEVQVRTKGLALGAYTEAIDIDSNGGRARIPVQMQVIPGRWWDRAPIWGLLIVCVLLAAGVIAGLIAFGRGDSATPTPIVSMGPPTGVVSVPGTPAAGVTITATVAGTVPTSTPIKGPATTRGPESTRGPTRTPTRRPSPTHTPVPLCADPRVRITSPRSGDSVRGMVEIWGTANIANFQYYKLEWRHFSTWSYIGRSYYAGNDKRLMTWDTSGVPTGIVRLRLVVVDRTGNYPEPCEIWLEITH